MSDITLRPFRSEDGKYIAAWAHDSVYAVYFRNLVISPTFEDCCNYPRWTDTTVMMIQLENDDSPIGMVVGYGYRPRSQSIGIGILIDKKYQKQGYGKAANNLFADFLFKTLGVRKVITEFIEEYLLLAYKKLGYQLEGKFIKQFNINGKWVDEYRMARFNE